MIYIIGCGLTGTTVARYLAEQGYKVTIIDKRNHIGGNCYDYVDENGLLIHKYGPHVFFTDDDEVWNFIKKYTQWYEYKSKAFADIDAKLLSMPFNLKTFDMLYDDKVKADKLKNKLINDYGINNKVYILDLLKSKNELIKNAAKLLYLKDYKPYNIKQWGLKPEQIDYTVTARIPIRINYDDYLKDEKYQYMPLGGFTKLFKNMLKHKNIEVRLNVDVTDIHEFIDDKNNIVLYTGRLDKIFGYEFGQLSYRTLKFTEEVYTEKNKLQSFVIYYPNLELDYTRQTDYSYLPDNKQYNKSIIIRETPTDYIDSLATNDIVDINNNYDEPYYVVLTDKTKDVYKKYLNKSKQINNLFVAGRLADYKYYNMDNAIKRGLSISKAIIEFVQKGVRNDRT